MQWIAPSKLGNREPVTLLGSLEAVLAAVPDRSILVVANMHHRPHVAELLVQAGRAPDALHLVSAQQCSFDDVMFRFPKETVVGVEPNAFDGELPSTYTRAYAHLARFRTVHWG